MESGWAADPADAADAHDAAASPAAGVRGEKRVESLKLLGRKEIAQPVALGGKDTDFSEYCKCWEWKRSRKETDKPDKRNRIMIESNN